MITIVVPAFNEEKLIGECLVSLKNQDYKNDYEIIVVDNASNDNTARAAREKGARVIYCAQKGVSYARQAGADAALGEIIVQADADTIYPSWWLTRIQKQFDSHPKAVAVAGTFIYKNPPWWGGFEYFLRVFFNLLTALILRRPYIISGANFAFYKKSLAQIGGYDPSAYSSDQFNISTRLGQIGKVVYDRGSWGATSARSVAKPVNVIFMDLLRHLKRFARHFFQMLGPVLKERSKKAVSAPSKKYLLLGVPVLLVGIMAYGYYIPSSPIFGKIYSQGGKQDKYIALTFDDGPNDPYTSQLLDVLEANDVKATFFLVGANVLLYPDTVKRMVADEDVLGNHTYSHNANHALSFSAYKEIALTQQVILNTAGVEPHLYRPPHGKKSPWELESIKNMGLAEVVWNISTNELSGKSAESMAQSIVQQAKPGGVILLHDGYGTLHGSGRADKSATVAMVPLIIQRLKAQGYTFVTIPQMLDLPAYDKVNE
jgi:peptidoglycan/xylan/chitin deacetylase (PgdA/CDA1 family)